MALTRHNADPAIDQPTDGRQGRRWLWAVAIAVVVALAIGAGAVILTQRSSDTTTAPAPQPSLSLSTENPFTPDPAPTATPTPTSPADLAKAGALAAYTRYQALSNRVDTSGKVSDAEIKKVAISSEFYLLKQARDVTAKQQASSKAVRSTGELRITHPVATVLNLKTGPAANVVPQVRVDACMDVRATKVFDLSGKDVTPAGRPLFYIVRVWVNDYPKFGGWLVARSNPIHAVKSC